MKELSTQKPTAIAPASDANQIIDLIGRLASDPNADIDKMERLMAMREKQLDREAKTLFNASFTAAQKEMPQVVRNCSNSQTHSKYVNEAALDIAITPIYTKHGFSLSFNTGKERLDGHEPVVCIVSHEAGHEREYFAQVPIAGLGIKGNRAMTETHGYGSTRTYARRYLKFDIWNIATTDNDGNAPNRDAVAMEYNDKIRGANTTDELHKIRADIMSDNELTEQGRKRAGQVWSAKIKAVEGDNGTA